VIRFKSFSLFIRAFLISIAGALQTITPLWASNPTSSASAQHEGATFSKEKLLPFEGRKIRKIQILGLTRTSETAVRGLLGGTEGDSFSSENWVRGLMKLYDTNALYDLNTEISPAQKSDEVEITLRLTDKWTLVPFFSFQGGGQFNYVTTGVYDTNLGGYFTNMSLGVSSSNGWIGYDVNLFQEFFLNTDLIFGLDVSKNFLPVIAPYNLSAINFIWSRDQVQFLLGRRLGSDKRFFTFLEVFRDQTLAPYQGFQEDLLPNLQYRIRPVLIFGRSNLTNFMEEGSELAFAPVTANFLDTNKAYHQLVVTYKNTSILKKDTNLAFFIGTGIMSSAPLAYQFHLGGFDTVRGFGSARMMGNLYANANLEFRPTLFQHRFSWSLLDWVVLQGCAFTDMGWMYNGLNSELTPVNHLALASAGLGIRMIFVKYSNAIIRLDWARTITPDEGLGFSFGIGQFF